jgi:hypothetical protein
MRIGDNLYSRARLVNSFQLLNLKSPPPASAFTHVCPARGRKKPSRPALFNSFVLCCLCCCLLFINFGISVQRVDSTQRSTFGNQPRNSGCGFPTNLLRCFPSCRILSSCPFGCCCLAAVCCRLGGKLHLLSRMQQIARNPRPHSCPKPDKSLALELYDHEKDPGENVNLAGQQEQSELVKLLIQQGKEVWRKATPVGP